VSRGPAGHGGRRAAKQPKLMEPTKTTAAAIVSLVKMQNETLGILREIVSRRREFLHAADRGAEECKRAADECHAAIREAERYLERSGADL